MIGHQDSSSSDGPQGYMSCQKHNSTHTQRTQPNRGSKPTRRADTARVALFTGYWTSHIMPLWRIVEMLLPVAGSS